jgi:ElaB/YqjD/DUF883 family membrane-anchored ribosome-binding protein
MADDPNAIRADIADTRERLSHTIEEIGERLNPQAIKENVKDTIREATLGRMSTMARQAADTVSRTTSGVGAAVRDNPMPMALVAVGIGWMIWNARSSRTTRYSSRGADLGYGPEYGPEYGVGYGTTSTRYGAGSASDYDRYDSSDEGYGATLGAEASYTDRSGSDEGVSGRARRKARQLGDAAQERAGMVADRARGVAGTARARAQQFYGSAQDVTRRGAMRVEDSFHENPLAVGAVAMAIGLAAGLAAPVTDREVRLMGDARDQVVDRVKDFADEAREKAGHVVSRVKEEARTAARDEGLLT